MLQTKRVKRLIVHLSSSTSSYPLCHMLCLLDVYNLACKLCVCLPLLSQLHHSKGTFYISPLKHCSEEKKKLPHTVSQGDKLVWIVWWDKSEIQIMYRTGSAENMMNLKWLTLQYSWRLCANLILSQCLSFSFSYLLVEQGCGQFLDFRSEQLGPSDDLAQCSERLVDTL